MKWYEWGEDDEWFYRADFVEIAEQVLRLSEHELTFDLDLFEWLHETLDT